jgi:hypothetical protein
MRRPDGSANLPGASYGKGPESLRLPIRSRGLGQAATSAVVVGIGCFVSARGQYLAGTVLSWWMVADRDGLRSV